VPAMARDLIAVVGSAGGVVTGVVGAVTVLPTVAGMVVVVFGDGDPLTGLLVVVVEVEFVSVVLAGALCGALLLALSSPPPHPAITAENAIQTIILLNTSRPRAAIRINFWQMPRSDV
jgi:hypothetical protein